jgi:hypothetical protein
LSLEAYSDRKLLPAGGANHCPRVILKRLRPRPQQQAALMKQLHAPEKKQLHAPEKKQARLEDAHRAAHGRAVCTFCVCRCDELASGEELCLRTARARTSPPATPPAHFTYASALDNLRWQALCSAPGRAAEARTQKKFSRSAYCRHGWRARRGSSERSSEGNTSSCWHASWRQNQALAAKRHVEEELITLKCRAAAAPCSDFTNCCVLTCGCGNAFCAWCVQDRSNAQDAQATHLPAQHLSRRAVRAVQLRDAHRAYVV